MKRVFYAVFAASLLFAIPAMAQSNPQAIGVTSKRAVLKTFVDADGQQKGAPIEVASVTFPLSIYEKSEKGLVRSKVNGVDVWLDPDQLLIAQPVNAICVVVKNQTNLTTGGVRGANEACK